jgi:NADPH:quinone reductase-like Zn-dependent oxidoreductase
VIGTASPQHHDRVRELGATEVLDYHEGPASEQLDEPVDAVLDLVGGEALEDAPKQVRDGGRIASIIDAATVRELGGTYVFVRPDRAGLDALARLVQQGKLRVDLAATRPLEEIAEAHRLSQSGHAGGKIAVTV